MTLSSVRPGMSRMKLEADVLEIRLSNIEDMGKMDRISKTEIK